MDDVKNTRGIDRFFSAVEVIRREVNKDLAFSQFTLFLAICVKEGQSVYDLIGHFKLPQPSTSKNLKELGKYIVTDKDGNKTVKGYDLIRAEPDLEERRILVYYLTPKGQALKEKIEKIINGEIAV